MRDGELLVSGRATVGNAVALAVLAGFVASVAMVLAFAVAFAVALLLGRLPLPVVGPWFLGLTHNPLIDTAGPNLYAATAVFVVGGWLWATLYALIFEPRLTGPDWQRGVLFALIPWVFSLVVFLPLVGGGVLGLGLGAGPLPVLGNLILHAVYGATLGVVFGSGESIVDRPLHISLSDDVRSGRLAELGAAKGMLAGFGLGVIAGALGTVLVPQGMNPLAMVVAIGLTGAAFGALYGSLAAAK